MNAKSPALLVVAALLLAACSAPMVNKSAPLDPRSGYLYGVLTLPPSQRLICDLRAGLALKEVGSEKEHFLELSRSEALSVFPIPPGRYQIQHIVYKTCEGMESGRKDFTSPLLSGEIEVKPATAVYIGHYEGQTSISSAGKMITQHWSMTRLCRDFVASTAQFQSGWKNLSPLPTIDGTTGGSPC